MKYRALCFCLLLLFTIIDAAAQDNSSFPRQRNQRLGMEQVANNSVSGSVTTIDGRPQRDARVEIRALGTDRVVASGFTQPNGAFGFDNLPSGTYEVVASVGLREARERLEVFGAIDRLHLLLPADTDSASGLGSNDSVSVAQLKVPDKARKLFSKAEEAFHKQKFSQAREEADKALQIFPKFAQALTLRGLLSLQGNKLDAARADLENAVQDDYSYGMGFIVLGATYNLMQRFDDASRVLERGIILMPGSWQAYFELSKTLLAKGQYEAALRQVDKATELGPAGYPLLHLVRAHALLGLHDYNRAVTELEQFLGNNPNSPDSAQARQTLNQVRAFMASKGK